MCLSKKVEKIGLDTSLNYERQQLRKKMWLVASVIDNRPLEHQTNQFYAALGQMLENLRRSVLIWENDDPKVKKELLSIIEEMSEIYEFDMSC